MENPISDNAPFIAFTGAMDGILHFRLKQETRLGEIEDTHLHTDGGKITIPVSTIIRHVVLAAEFVEC